MILIWRMRLHLYMTVWRHQRLQKSIKYRDQRYEDIWKSILIYIILFLYIYLNNINIIFTKYIYIYIYKYIYIYIYILNNIIYMLYIIYI